MVQSQISEVVNVNVTLEDAPLSPASFGRACILGTHTVFAETFRLYTSLAGMISDGFTTADEEYIEAAALLAQYTNSGRTVRDFLIGKRATAVAQIDTGTVTYDASSTYSITLSGKGIAPVTVGPVAANTDADTTAGDIATAIDASSFGGRVNCAAVGGSSGQYTVTSTQAGIPFTMTVTVAGGAGTHTSTTSTANVGIAEDLAQMVTDGASWYMTIPVSRDAREIVEAAAWHESASPVKVLLAQHSESGTLSTAYSAGSPYNDLCSELKALGYNRTATLYHGTDTAAAASAWAGYCLPFDPGTITWNAKPLVGITADSLTPSQVSILAGTATAPTGGKNGNCYIPLNDTISRTLRGMLASGRWIDEQRTLDMLQNALETAIANLILSRAKIPFNDSGIQEFVAVIATTLAGYQAGATPVLDPETEISITAPESSAVTTSDRGNRILTGLTATARLAGAIHYVAFNLTVTV